ncbi:GNAT family N-acetyltransferase [Streptomyces sp. NPDC001941]|uniref:GNAT family N-acetyltransferase n=1 Tax=Streptomyces sp. NPDC001941 TaxID=3154659 RepID=UPI003328341E
MDDGGLSLWLTDWHVQGFEGWLPRRIVALASGRAAGHVEFTVHPDGKALSVQQLLVYQAFQRRGIGSAMMDAVYAAHPQAWIDHGSRTPNGILWWDGYNDPAPDRNIHNRPPLDWARYFDPVVVFRQRATNARSNIVYKLDGHQDAEYRYGERLEGEAARWLYRFQSPPLQGPDPTAQDLYAGIPVLLDRGVHLGAHNDARDPSERGQLILDAIGQGNLPAGACWHATERAAFEEVASRQLFDPRSDPANTVVVFRARLTSGPGHPEPVVSPTWVRYPESGGFDVSLSGMSWRSTDTPWNCHRAAFTPPLDAAVHPTYMLTPSPHYAQRYDELGDLLPGQPPRHGSASAAEDYLSSRVQDILAAAAMLNNGAQERLATKHLPAPASTTHQDPRTRTPDNPRPPHRGIR